MYKREQTLSDACSLRSFYLFSPLLKGDQFYAYLTAQAQNLVPRIFVFLTTKPTKTRTHSLIYDYY